MSALDTPPAALNNPDVDEEDGHKPSYAAVASGVAHADDLVVEEGEEEHAALISNSKSSSAVGAGAFGPHPPGLASKQQQQPSAPAVATGFPLLPTTKPRRTTAKNAAGVNLSAGEKCIQGIANPITCVPCVAARL